MFLFLVFAAEYVAGELAYSVFDGWIYLEMGWFDLNPLYYMAVASIDIVVVSALLRGTPKKEEIIYAALATASFVANASGLYVYSLMISDAFYLSVMQTILVLKFLLILNKALSHVTIHARDIAICIVSSMASSVMCLYLWEMVKTNQETRWAQ